MEAEVVPSVSEIDARLQSWVPRLKDGGPEVQAEARREIDRLLDLRNELGMRALGLSEVEQL